MRIVTESERHESDFKGDFKETSSDISRELCKGVWTVDLGCGFAFLYSGSGPSNKNFFWIRSKNDTFLQEYM